MIDLDDVRALEKNDPTDFLGVVEGLADQVVLARQTVEAAEGLLTTAGIEGVCVLGMGGSGIAGDFAQVALGRDSPLYFEAVKGYELPGWVGPSTLVFAVSYSGNTEETLATMDRAARRGARLVVVASGGKAAEWGKERGLPLLLLPPGVKQRAALGYLATTVIAVLERAGLADAGPALDETVESLGHRSAEWGRETPQTENYAKQIAGGIAGKVTIVYGTEGLAGVAAYRWKCQLNECGKAPAWSNVFSELNHNEVVGWGDPDRAAAGVQLVVLRHEGEHPQNRRRVEATLPLIRDSVSAVHEVWGRGESDLARLFDLVYLGDFAATYVALGREIDPAPVEVIEQLKREIAD